MSDSNPYSYQGRQPEGPADTLAHALNITFGGKWHPHKAGDDCRATHDNGVAIVASLDEQQGRAGTPTAYRAIYAPHAQCSGFGETPLAALLNLAANYESEIYDAVRLVASLRSDLEAVSATIDAAGYVITEKGE